MNTPTQNIIETLKGKKVLFLENSNSLEYGLKEFEKILKEANIKYKTLFKLQDLQPPIIMEAIDNYEAIVFQTTWKTSISREIYDYVGSLSEKKIIVECFLKEPTWYYASQHGTHHDVYLYSCPVFYDKVKKEEEEFYKLTEKAYWNYENKFDK